MFSLLVRWVLSLLEPPFPLPFSFILTLCYIGTVAQATILVALGRCEEGERKGGENERERDLEKEEEVIKEEEGKEEGKEEEEEEEDKMMVDDDFMSSDPFSPSSSPSPILSPPSLCVGGEESISIHHLRRLVSFQLQSELKLGRYDTLKKGKRGEEMGEKSETVRNEEEKTEEKEETGKEEKEFVRKVELLCLPFLRQSLLFERVCQMTFSSSTSSSFDVDQKLRPHEQFELIRNHFNLPSLLSLTLSPAKTLTSHPFSSSSPSPSPFPSSSFSFSSFSSFSSNELPSLGLLISRWIYEYSQSPLFSSPLPSPSPPSSPSSSSLSSSTSSSSSSTSLPASAPPSSHSFLSFFGQGVFAQKPKEKEEKKMRKMDPREKRRVERIPPIASFEQFCLVPLPSLFQVLFFSSLYFLYFLFPFSSIHFSLLSFFSGFVSLLS